MGLLDLLGDFPTWMREAACRAVDPDLFFPERGDAASLRAARAVCAGCSVREECLSYALERNERLGVWGGLSTQERRRVKRQAAA